MLWGLGLITPLDHLTFNSWLRARGPIGWDSRIVVVKVDDETLADLGQFPIERHYYTSLVEQLTVAQASAVGFNIMFLDASIDDQALAKAIEAHGRVVLGQTWDSRGLPIQPNPTLQNAAIAAGHLRQPIDSDGISRRVEVTAAGVAALGVEVAQVYSLVAEAVNIPHIHELWINWPGNVADLSQYSLSDVLAGEVPLQVFQDKIVLVGVTATGLATLSTPYNIQPPVGSVYLHAAVVNTLLQGKLAPSHSSRTIRLTISVSRHCFGILPARSQFLDTNLYWHCHGTRVVRAKLCAAVSEYLVSRDRIGIAQHLLSHTAHQS